VVTVWFYRKRERFDPVVVSIDMFPLLISEPVDSGSTDVREGKMPEKVS